MSGVAVKDDHIWVIQFYDPPGGYVTPYGWEYKEYGNWHTVFAANNTVSLSIIMAEWSKRTPGLENKWRLRKRQLDGRFKTVRVTRS